MEFSYLAYSMERGVVKGRLKARSELEARQQVSREGYKLLRLAPVRRFPGISQLSLRQVGRGELVHFARQMAIMLNAGGSLLRALGMLQSSSLNPVMRRTLGAIHINLSEGGNLSSALAEYPNLFSPLFITVVEAGESTGKLGPALEQLADILEKEQEAKRRAMRALMYPLAIVGLSTVTLGVLVTVALPPLLDVFQRMDADIPLTTRIAVALAEGVKDNMRNMFLGTMAGAGALLLLRRAPRARLWMDTATARTPILGSFIVAGEISRFSRTVAMLLEAGVPLVTALHLGTRGCKNLLLRRAFAGAEASIMSGHGLAEALRHYRILPPIFVELVMTGEDSNSLRQIMSSTADAYQQEVERRLNSLLGMLEPASTLVVGGIVGFIAFSMFVPIYSGMNALG